MSCFCFTQLAIWMYFFYYALNNFIVKTYLVSCSLQGVWVFENIGDREEIINNIMTEIDQCEGWRNDVTTRWVQADFNSTHSVCTVDFTTRSDALSTLREKCQIGSPSVSSSSWGF